jgi:hypothetical protein
MRFVVPLIVMLGLGSSALAAKTPELPKAPTTTKVVTSQKAPTTVRAALRPAEHRIITTPTRVSTSQSIVRPRIRTSQPMLQMPSALRSLRYQLELHDMAAALRQ